MSTCKIYSTNLYRKHSSGEITADNLCVFSQQTSYNNTGSKVPYLKKKKEDIQLKGAKKKFSGRSIAVVFKGHSNRDPLEN